jgi:hypothetical protein
MSALVRRRPPTEPAVVDGQEFRSDYADRFVVEPVDGRPAEVWARGTLEGGPAALRWFINFGWRYVLGLRLHRDASADHVAGWPIARRDPSVVVLGVDSRVLGRARLTFTASDASASASSDVEFDQRGARAVWAVAGLLHRRVLPYLLGHAVRHA